MIRRFLCLAALVSLIALSAGCEHDSCSPQDLCFEAEAEFTADIPAAGGIPFALYGFNGDVDLIGEGPGELIRLSAHRRVRSDSREDAERRLEDLHVRIETDGDEIQIRTEQPQDTEGRSYAVDYTVHVPEDCHSRVIMVNGNIRARNLGAGAYLRTTNGTIDAVGLWGAVDILTTNGNITADLPIATTDDVHFSSINGNLALTIPAATSARVHMAVTNGVISTLGLDWEDSASHDRAFVGRLGSGETEITLSTMNGDITLQGR